MVKRRYLVSGWIVVCCWVSSTSSFTEPPRTRKVWDINYRQVGPPPAPPPAPPPQPTGIAHPPQPAPAPPPPNNPGPPAHQTVLSPPSILPPIIPTSQSLSHPSIISTPSVLSIPNTTSSSLLPSSTSATTTTIITITALPPLDPTAVPTIVTRPKKTFHADSTTSKLIYLAPVFVLLGLLWGSLVAWFVYGCLTRKPKYRDEGDLIGGPRYVPASRGEGEDDLEEGSGRTGGDATMMQEATFSWPDLSEKAVARKLGGQEQREPGFTAAAAAEEGEHNMFLTPPPFNDGERTNPSLKKPPLSMRAKSARSTMTTHSDATYMYDTDDGGSDGHKKEEFDLPWESLRHKSIKRGILEKVAWEEDRINGLRPMTGTLSLRSTGVVASSQGVEGVTAARRPSRHGRSDSDVLVGDVQQALEGREHYPYQHHHASQHGTGVEALLSPSNRPTGTRANSTHTTFSTDSCHTQSTATPGFRIVVDDEPIFNEPVSSPAPDDALTVPFLPSPDSEWHQQNGHGDRYTHLPQRRTTDRSQSLSQSKGPGGPSPGGSLAKDGPHVSTRNLHANVLPQSPPQINSPLLHSALCFVTTPPDARKRAMAAAAAAANTLPGQQPLNGPKDNDKTQSGRKLLSPKSPPSSYPAKMNRAVQSPRSDPYRGNSTSANGPSPSPSPVPPRSAKRHYYKGLGRASDAEANARRVLHKNPDVADQVPRQA